MDMGLPGQTFRSRAWWLIALSLGLPLILIVVTILVPACNRWLRES